MGWRSKPQQPPHVPDEWPEPSLEPRVLVENADDFARWATRRLLERSGFEVADCSGPDAGHGWQCPVTQGEPCTQVEGADAIVFSLDLRSDEGREILASHRQELSERPVVAEVTAPEAGRHRDLLDDCAVVNPSGLGDLVGAVVSALKDRSFDH
ncbi:MAG: hypothetical protein WEB06_18980 [Actinomycetota bacterium]